MQTIAHRVSIMWSVDILTGQSSNRTGGNDNIQNSVRLQYVYEME